MENILVKQLAAPVSLCDNNGLLSTQGILTLFMDMASEHGTMIRLGADDLAQKGLIWLVVRTKLLIHERPAILTPITVKSWPEKPGRIRCNRYYTLAQGDRILAEGKNEWAMLETATGRLHKIEDSYPGELVHLQNTACDSPYTRMSEDFSDCEAFAAYVVRSTDIDTSQHMNNVNYARAVLGAFSCKELEEMSIREMEISYRVQCYEGEALTLRKRTIENGYEIGVIKEDGKTAAIVRLICAEK